MNNHVAEQAIFQNIIDTLPLMLFWTDVNHVVIGNNLVHAKAFGYEDAAELIGKSVAEVLRHANVSDGLIERIYREHNQIIKTKKGIIVEYTNVLLENSGL